MLGGGGKYYLLNVVFLSKIKLYESIHTKSFRYSVGLAFIPFCGWVEGARGQNLVHLQKGEFS